MPKSESGRDATGASIYGTVDGDIRAARIDKETRALVTATMKDDAFNSGSAFTSSYAAAIATNTTLTLLAITTATTKYTDLDIDVSLGGNTDIKLYELATTQAVAGTTSTTYNQNRSSAITSSTTVTSSPSAVTVSTTILYAYHVASANNISLPKFRLAASKRYYLVCTPQLAGTSTMGAVLKWIDYTDQT